LIGWYHSGPKLRSSDLKINELFKRYTPNPVLVIIDVKPNDAEIPTDAYFAIEEIKDVRRFAAAAATFWKYHANRFII
jgi:26S proteasome regulatory subunit N8